MAPDRPPARQAVLVFLFFAVLYAGVTRGHLMSTDEVLAYEATRTLWREGVASVTVREDTNTSPGRYGREYSAVGSAQSIAALPLYALGRGVEVTLDNLGRDDWIRAFAGQPQSRRGLVWSGEVEIFFVCLHNALVMALICAVFYAFLLRLDVTPRPALVTTAFMGTGCYLAGYASTFYTQPVEALGMLWAFYLLYADSREPGAPLRWGAGAVTAFMVACRWPALTALPGLLLYQAWTAWQRTREPRACLAQSAPLLAGVATGLLVHAADNYWKFETIRSQAAYASPSFDNALGLGLAGFLVSPGDSIFLYTPLLFLAPAWMLPFLRRHRAEALYILLQLTMYLVCCSKFAKWHGLWCFGPRYLAAVTPLVLLPLGPWLQGARLPGRLLAGFLAAAGALVTASHLLVNWWVVTVREGWLASDPMWAFLFDPKQSPLLAQVRALLAWDPRIDFWLANLQRDFGTSWMAPFLATWLIALSLCGWMAWRATGRAAPPDFRPCARPAALACIAILSLTLTFAALESSLGGPDPEAPLMRAGLAALKRGNTSSAVSWFEIALQRNPSHYGATYQLARALDFRDDPARARLAWAAVEQLASTCGDQETLRIARERLAR